MSIRNGKAREGSFDVSQSCLDLYWKISVYFLSVGVMVCAEKFSMSVGSALFIVKNYKSSQEHGRPAEAEPNATICVYWLSF